MELVTCPTCSGAKRSVAIVRGAFGPRGGLTCREMVFDCPTCKGNGTITNDHLLRIKRGEKMRRERIDRGETLRQAAERMGIDYVELSHIEGGRTP